MDYYNHKMQLENIQPIGILFYEDGQHHGESQHARPTVT